MAGMTNLMAGAATLALCGAALAGTAMDAQAATPFYADKTITFMIGQAAGGGSDLNCRIWAEYLPKYIPGNPTIIVKSMPSADNILATNYVGIEAKKDGLTLRCGGFGYAAQLTKSPGLKVDFTTFQYIMGDGSPDVLSVRTDVAPGLKVPDDVFKAKGLILGGTAVDSLKDVSQRALLEVSGLKYQYVTGFTGEGAIRAALQQKFVNMEPDSTAGFIGVTEPTLVKTGVVIPVWQAGDLDASGHLTARDAGEPDVPNFYEVYKQHFGKAPSGIGWDLAEATWGVQQQATFVLALPQGSPPEAITALKGAVAPMNLDPGYIDAVEKLRGKGSRERDGAFILSAVKRFVDMPPQLVEHFNAVIASGEEAKKQQPK